MAETKNTMLLTRKIQLFINCNRAEEIEIHRKKLYRWRYITFRALNMVTSHLFVQEQLKDFFYFTQDFHLKLKDEIKGDGGVLNTSKLNTSMRLLSKLFKGEIPNDILCCLNHELCSLFNKELKAYRNGERSLRNYQRKQPMPFKGRSIKVLKPEDREFTFTLFKIPFRTYLGKDKEKRKLLAEVLQGKTKLCTSHISMDKGKIFMMATFEVAKQNLPLDDMIIAEASLSVNYPITLKIDDEQYIIGNKEEFLHRRLAIQAARLRTLKGSTFNRGGHGYRRKIKAADCYNGLEERYIDHKLHLYSKRLIDLCMNKRAATLILINQQEKEEIAKQDEFLLQNWSYFSLKEKITYKARLIGITVVVE
ncbi:hypothetical protein DU508_15300 [Pedobacter chinensis]|uniref:Transposase n=2 Tax=Pedobacter chinensis TaxID=2282421 RepID=A0A369PTI3_9SPHI|nr:hypothetical protein DU508_15300 [Pedobacter chinensis]